MSSIVLDSSAMLAYLNNEPGGDQVAEALPGSMVSSVNVAEVVTKVVSRGSDPATVARIFHEIEVVIVDFTTDLAFEAGALVARTKHCGLSLGDRACLALALRERLPVLTADRVWKDLQVGVEIRLIR